MKPVRIIYITHLDFISRHKPNRKIESETSTMTKKIGAYG